MCGFAQCCRSRCRHRHWDNNHNRASHRTQVLNQKIPLAYRSIDRQSLSEEAVKHVLDDVAHLVDSLRMVRGLRDRGRTIDRFFRDKFVLGLT